MNKETASSAKFSILLSVLFAVGMKRQVMFSFHKIPSIQNKTFNLKPFSTVVMFRNASLRSSVREKQGDLLLFCLVPER